MFGFVVPLLIVVGALAPVVLLLRLVPVLAVFLPVLAASVFPGRRRWRKPIVLMRVPFLRRHVIFVLLLHWFLAIVAPRILRAVVLLLVSLLIGRIVGTRVILPLICILLVLRCFVILVVALILASRGGHLRLALVLVLLIWPPAGRTADLFESDVHKL